MMLHCGAWRWQEYLSLIPSLGQRWHVHALDLRGHGRSGWVPDPYRLQDFTKDNAEFLDPGRERFGRWCPMLFLRGETKLGAVMTNDELSWLEQNYKNVKCRVFEGLGHLLHLEDHGRIVPNDYG